MYTYISNRPNVMCSRVVSYTTIVLSNIIGLNLFKSDQINQTVSRNDESIYNYELFSTRLHQWKAIDSCFKGNILSQFSFVDISASSDKTI